MRLPVIVSLSQNGIRLRFDGPDQRLRLIEIVDYSRLTLTYKNTKSASVVKVPVTGGGTGLKGANGPSYRQIYDIFSVTFPGEYFGPKKSARRGAYVLSYPGLAFLFSVEHSIWSTKSQSDFVAVLSSSAASPACSLAIFNGSSWKEARQDYLTRQPPLPRTIHSSGRTANDDVEMVRVRGKGHVQIIRRFSRLEIVLGRTTPQDLVSNLGPPDSIYRKNDYRLAIHKRRNTSTPARPIDLQSSTYRPEDDMMSAITDESQSEEELASAATANGSPRETECFYNYFRYGFDVYLSDTTNLSPPLSPIGPDPTPKRYVGNGGLVATKMVLHANVPGSYAFNRYRRCRWYLDHNKSSDGKPLLTSEARFSEIGKALRKAWKGNYLTEDERRIMERPMVLNRGWTDSPGSSCELLGELDESELGMGSDKRSNRGVGNTELWGFPGLLFEVLRNDAVSCLTVY